MLLGPPDYCAAAGVEHRAPWVAASRGALPGPYLGGAQGRFPATLEDMFSKTIIDGMPKTLLKLRKDFRPLSDTAETTPARVASLGPTQYSVAEWRGAQGSVAAAAGRPFRGVP